jgi:hypothetical protein
MAVVPRRRACECCRNHSITRTNDHSASSLGRDENHRLKKTESLKENDGITERSRPLVSRAAQVTSTLARSVASDSHSSGAVAKPPINRPMPAYPLYNYADNIPKPKVIYIKNEEDANEMVTSLNG